MIQESISPAPTPWFQRSSHLGQPPGNIGFILERLRGLPIRLEQLLAGSPEHMLTARINDKWSVREQIGHLMDLDRLTMQRLTDILNGQAELRQASFRLEADYNDWPTADLLQALFQTRTVLLQTWETLTSEELGRSGLHPRLRLPFTALDLAYFDAEHDDHHLYSIRTILTQLKN